MFISWCKQHKKYYYKVNVMHVYVQHRVWKGRRFLTRAGQLDCIWNVMAHAQKPDFVFQRNGWVHLNRWERQFSRLLAGELCTSACMVCTSASLCFAVMWRLLVTHSILVSPSLLLLCIVCHHISTGLYYIGHFRSFVYDFIGITKYKITTLLIFLNVYTYIHIPHSV
jgi:hypothetical protein